MSRIARRSGMRTAVAIVTVAVAVVVASFALGAVAQAATVQVSIVDFAFSPQTITINQGDTVTWTNKGAIIHTTTSTTGLWDSGILQSGGTFSHTFDQTGTFDYTCTIHGFTGRVIVQGASTTSSSTTTTSSTTTSSSTTTTTMAGGATFVDVPPGSPFFDAIQGLANAGIIGGYDIGGGMKEYRPLNDVLRAQFAKIIVGAFGITVVPNAPIPFTDVTRDASGYPWDYVAAAYNANVTQGRTATSFSPYTDVLRAQVTTLVVRALQQLHPGLLQDPPAGYQNTWGTSFSSIHGPLARIAEYNGLLDGLPLTTTSSNPLAPMTRGEVAQVLWNAMQLIGG